MRLGNVTCVKAALGSLELQTAGLLHNPYKPTHTHTHTPLSPNKWKKKTFNKNKNRRFCRRNCETRIVPENRKINRCDFLRRGKKAAFPRFQNRSVFGRLRNFTAPGDAWITLVIPFCERFIRKKRVQFGNPAMIRANRAI